jgi:uncharacterized protein (TIGR02246 family)
MRLLTLCLVIVVAASGLAFAATEDEQNQIETAIKNTIQSYVEAFNKGDADALVAHWTKDGDYITATGEVFTGQEKLKAAFEAFFKDKEGIKIEVEPLAIYVEGSDKAIEEGLATTTRSGEEPETTRYVTAYVKKNGDWKITTVKEIVPMGTSPNHDKLEPLEWMIGDWVDADQSGKLETTCYWSADGNFIVRAFEVSVGGLTTFGGKQIIGWDPAAKQIRSWVFDTNGGFGEGTWSKQGDSWHVNSTIVLNTGEKVASTNILTPVDENTFTWKATGREVGGVPLPETAQVKVVRKPAEANPNESDEK